MQHEMIPDPLSNILNRLNKIETILGIEWPIESAPIHETEPVIENPPKKEDPDRLFLFKLRSAYRKVSNTSKIKNINYEELEILNIINQNNDIFMHQLTSLLCRDYKDIQRMLSIMGNKGWIRKKKSNRDRRAMDLSLTETGDSILKKYYPTALKHEEGLKSLFINEEYKIINQAMERIINIGGFKDE